MNVLVWNITWIAEIKINQEVNLKKKQVPFSGKNSAKNGRDLHQEGIKG